MQSQAQKDPEDKTTEPHWVNGVNLNTSYLESKLAELKKYHWEHRNDLNSGGYYNNSSTSYYDYYAILGVSKNASQTQIDEAFVKASKKYDPDNLPQDIQGQQETIQAKKLSKEIFSLIKLAHAQLSNPDKKMVYDSQLKNDPVLQYYMNYSDVEEAFEDVHARYDTGERKMRTTHVAKNSNGDNVLSIDLGWEPSINSPKVKSLIADLCKAGVVEEKDCVLLPYPHSLQISNFDAKKIADYGKAKVQKRTEGLEKDNKDLKENLTPILKNFLPPFEKIGIYNSYKNAPNELLAKNFLQIALKKGNSDALVKTKLFLSEMKQAGVIKGFTEFTSQFSKDRVTFEIQEFDYEKFANYVKAKEGLRLIKLENLKETTSLVTADHGQGKGYDYKSPLEKAVPQAADFQKTIPKSKISNDIAEKLKEFHKPDNDQLDRYTSVLHIDALIKRALTNPNTDPSTKSTLKRFQENKIAPLIEHYKQDLGIDTNSARGIYGGVQELKGKEFTVGFVDEDEVKARRTTLASVEEKIFTRSQFQHETSIIFARRPDSLKEIDKLLDEFHQKDKASLERNEIAGKIKILTTAALNNPDIPKKRKPGIRKLDEKINELVLVHDEKFKPPSQGM